MKRNGAILAFAIASGAAVAAGAAILAMSGSPTSTWVRNPAAWIVGALLAVAASRLKQPWHFAGLIAASFAALAGTFAAAPVEGVHRWLDLGPLHMNAAALVLPAMIASLARLEQTWAKLSIVAAAGAILVLQPDASQASAFAAGSVVLLVRTAGSTLEKLASAVLCVAVAIAGWMRLDSLEPVAEVEGIFALAGSVSIALAIVASAALAATCLAPLGGGRGWRSDNAALALIAYFTVTALAPLVGSYPVPLVGLGMSFPVGWWLGVALAAGPSRTNVR